MLKWMFWTSLFCACCAVGASPDVKEQVRQREVAFARTMADRNLSAFSSFLSKEAVFLSQNHAARGPQRITAEWKGFFEGPTAPFSWEPDQVEVLDSGTLAMTSGPVKDPQGKRIGTFHSVWRREKGAWKVVLDNGCPRCQCDAPAK
jgi:ketosteroid isomerase-like protein